MSDPANDQPLNLKHRLTGAVILIGLAVAVMSLLLDPEESQNVSRGSEQTADDSFVSRIVSTDDNETRVPAPTTAPTERTEPPASVKTPAELPETAGEGADRESPSGNTPASAAEAALRIEPVLEPHTSLPSPAPRINTVEADTSEDDSGDSGNVSSSAPDSTAAAQTNWVVRVGAFSKQDNADGISRRLRDGGYPPSSAAVNVNGKSMVRVWVGPYPDRKAAIRAKSEISRHFDLNGFVARQP